MSDGTEDVKVDHADVNDQIEGPDIESDVKDVKVDHADVSSQIAGPDIESDVKDVQVDHADVSSGSNVKDVQVDHNSELTEKGDNSSGILVPSETYLTTETLDKITSGFLSYCLPDLQRAKGALSEILTNQTVLMEAVQNENAKFKVNDDIEQTMIKAKLYHSKLLFLKKEMSSLTEKSFKLKKRGLKLQQQKLKEELNKKEQEEKEKLREEMLTAKVAKKRTSSQSEMS